MMFCFNEFAFIVQVKHKINSSLHKFLALYFDMFLFCDWPFPYMCILQRMQHISILILGSVFSDCVVFYGDITLGLDRITLSSPQRIALLLNVILLPGCFLKTFIDIMLFSLLFYVFTFLFYMYHLLFNVISSRLASCY